MSWNGVGGFTRIFSWVADKNAGLNISSSRMDTDSNDIASNGFGNCLTRDGQGFATANLPMGNFRHTGVGNGVARSDYAAMGQAQDGLLFWSTAGGTADALTVTLTPAITVLADGQLIHARAGFANATTTPTLAVNGLTAHTITKRGGGALVAGDIPGNLAQCEFRYDLANTRFELLNPAVPTYPAGSVTNAALANMAAWTFKVNNTSGSAAPTDVTIDGLTVKASPTSSDEVPIWDAAASALKKATIAAVQSALSFSAPTVQTFTSGTSLTYTPTAGFKRIKVRMCGGGAGGGATSTNAGSSGNATSFGGWTANGGSPGQPNSSAPIAGGTGGTNGTGTLVVRIPGGTSGGAYFAITNSNSIGGLGGATPFFGGAGMPQQDSAGGNAVANTGGGGAGGGPLNGLGGSGGSSGEYVEFWMTAAQVGASQTYTVGAVANGGAAGGQAGGNGAAGQIVIEEFYI